MKKILIGGIVGAAIAIALVAYFRSDGSLVQRGFTGADIRKCEQTIRGYYLDQIKNSSSAVERQQVADGITTVDVQMIKVADRRLEGFAKIRANTREAKDVGFSEITQTCEATMEMDSTQFIWKCHVER